MGEFDDVLAMEPGDEWDDHRVDASTDAETAHGPLQATVRLPHALVELRGDTPAEVLDELADLSDDTLELLGDVATLTLSVRPDGDVWVIGGREGSERVDGDRGALLRALTSRLGQLAVATDPMRLHLDVACVSLDGDGIVLVEASPDVLDGTISQPPVVHPPAVDPADDSPAAVSPAVVDPAGALVRDGRTLVVADLLELGAHYVAAELVSLLPGSRTVFGHPSPPSTTTHPPVRASHVAEVQPHVQADQVVVLRRVPGAPLRAVALDPALAAVHLLHAAKDLERIGVAALDVIAQVIGGSRCTLVEYADAAEVAAAVAALGKPGPRRLTVVHRFDDTEAVVGPESDATGAHVPTPVRRGRASLRVARFDTTGAMFDGVTGAASTLTSDELDALEALLVPAAALGGAGGRQATDAASTNAASTDSATDALARLRDAGIRIPSAAAARPVPGIEAFGLPNCPAGAVAATMWSAELARRTLTAASAEGADVPGAVAQAVERHVVTPPPEQQGSILDRHELARRLVALVEVTLHEVLDLAARHSIAPLVLGSVVLAHDGLLPADFSDAEQVDLLVAPDALATLRDELLAAGYELASQTSTDVAEAPLTHEMVKPGAVPVRVQLRSRLTVGPFAALVSHEDFHERSVPVRIGGRWCRTLHPEDRFVLTCVQLDLDTTHSTVQDLRDVVLGAPRIETHMGEALEASARWGATTNVVASLQRVHAVMPGLSPWLVDRSERSDGRGRRRADTPERPSRTRLLRRR